MNLFELSLRWKGFPLEEAKKQLKYIQSIPENEYGAYIEQQRMALLQHHLTHNPFYQGFCANRSVLKWKDVPIMQKSDLQKPLKERLSNGYTPKNVYVNKTSGSSGHPFIFAKDKLCHALTWAEILDRFGWYGIDFNSTLQARFYGIPLDWIGYQKERIKDLLSARYRFPIFDFSDKKLEKILRAFRKKPFDYINGYTSSIVLFAKFLNKKGIHLKEICPTLRYCIVTSEMLFESDKKLMESCFGVPVVNEYGASELDLIAFTNRENEFVLNNETLYVEILDEKDRPVPLGKEGRIVITGLYNLAHPMIRYDIGDTGALDEKSTAKNPLLKTLIGRTNDVAHLPSGKTVPGLTFYYVTKSIIEDDGNVKEFVIEQHQLDRFKIMYTSHQELLPEEIATIKKALFQYLEDGLTLEFSRIGVLDRTKRGKLKQFVSYL